MLANELKDVQSSFNRAAGIARWISTTGIRYALQWWFGKQAMFYLPKGWVPYAAEWILSFPSAPLGSISINMWWIACSSVISLVSGALTTVWAVRNGEVDLKDGSAPQAYTASNRPGTVEPSEKKEL